MARRTLTLVLAFLLANQKTSLATSGSYVLEKIDSGSASDLDINVGGHSAELESLLNMIRESEQTSDTQPATKRDEEPLTCKVGLPQSSPPVCRQSREQKLHKERQLYRLGYRQPLPMPLLDITPRRLIEYYHLSKDDFAKTHTMLYLGTLNASATLLKRHSKFYPDEITEYRGYEEVVKFFTANLQDPAKTKLLSNFIKFASEHEPFKSVTEQWREDNFFTDLRFAGPNPLAIRKVTPPRAANGIPWDDLKRNLSTRFDWQGAVQHAMRKKLPLDSAIRKGLVYALRYENFDSLSAGQDVTEHRRTRHMVPPMSPVGVFAVRQSRGSRGKSRLYPVAIQMDYTPDSPIYTPRDGSLWTWAKLNLQVTDFLHSQIEQHLVKTHLLVEPFCVCLARQLPERHPLHQLLRYHCRGVMLANTVGSPTLTNPGHYTDQLFPLGHIGTREVVRRTWLQTSWDDTDFIQQMKNRGMDDKSLIPYFPYRDDGELIHTAINRMVQDYVNLYYEADRDVSADYELQAYLNELSADGSGADGGLAKIRKLPSQVGSKGELIEFVTRLLWVTVGKHAALDYPVADYGAFTPLIPTKMYQDDRVAPGQFSIFNLPSGKVAAIQASVAMNIGALRCDKLLDYGEQLEDSLAGAIVKGHHEYLQGVVDVLIADRNRQRLADGHQTYPYFLSRWMTNSIQA